MGEVVPPDYPVLEDDTEYLVEVEVYDWPVNGGGCGGPYIENTECLATGWIIKTWLSLNLECFCEEVLCPGDWECGAQRIVKIAAV